MAYLQDRRASLICVLPVVWVRTSCNGALTYPSTVGSEYEDELREAPLPFMEHTLIWEYEPGKTDEETEQNFLRAARASIAEITALPITELLLWTGMH